MSNTLGNSQPGNTMPSTLGNSQPGKDHTAGGLHIGVLTGGGDCPGLNAVIRAIVRKATRVWGDSVTGFRNGWKGLLDDESQPLDVEALRGTLPRGGTIIGTSRIQPYMFDDGVARVRATVERYSLDALVVIGGEGTLSVARRISEEGFVPVVGVPKTIDNDVAATEMTFGFQTAVQIAVDAIDRLHSTAESHHRIMIVEVMGRNVGHIATWAGIAGGATLVLVPEEPFDIDHVARVLKLRHETNRYASIVVVAEGAQPLPGTIRLPPVEKDEFGHKRLSGIANVVAGEIERRTGLESRVLVLGHIQRGGTPCAYDRVLCTRYGIAAIDAIHAGETGQMVALKCDQIVNVPLKDATADLKYVSPELLDTTKVFFPPSA